MDADPETPTSFTFGRFQVLPHRRQFLVDGRPVELGGRAFDILMTLLEAAGTVVDRDTLMRRVWPGRIVEENVLWVQVSTLRAAFGAERDLIRTVARRGYQFGGEISELSVRAERPCSTPTNLPEAVSDLIGRDDDLGALVSFAAEHRLVTLTGPGGIGKTRLALAAARQIRPRFADGVWLAELAPLSDGALVPCAVAAAAGLELPGGEMTADSVASALGGRTVLIVLDNCEHVVGAAALLVATLLSTNPAVSVIATSREPLMVDGEWVMPAPALAVPTGDVEHEGDPVEFGAVQLFCERVRALQPAFVPDRRLAAEIGAICRRLDGIPLAIELAAARAASLGVEELAARLDDRFQLLTGGRRTALPRHQTLRATLDWSYELLAESERVALRRLAVFAGPFGLEAAIAVMASPEVTSSSVVDCLSDLVAKSLVAVEADATLARYRLLETTRAYAHAKVVDSGEFHAAARRHAEYYRDLFERADIEWERQLSADRLAAYGRQIDNLRVALDWSFSPQGDPAVGIALAAATERLWMDLGLAEELRRHAERALAALGAGARPDEWREMKLLAALAAALSRTAVPVSEWARAWESVLEIAERLNNVDYQLRALYGLNSAYSIAEQFPVALEWAERYRSLASARADISDELIGERLVGVCRFFLGDLRTARRHFERVLAYNLRAHDQPHHISYQANTRLTVCQILSRTLWQQGFPDQAMDMAETVVEEAAAIDDIVTMCDALYGGGCIVALWVGDLDRAEQFTRMLLDLSTRFVLPRWRAIGQCYESVLAMKRGDIPGGLRLLEAVVGQQDGTPKFSAVRMMFQGDIAESLGRAGRIDEGLALVETAIERCEAQSGSWTIAELLRVNGELVLLQGGDASTAEAHFRQALDWAHRQGALSWELRAATSLARLLRDQGRAADALLALQPVFDRFTEGFDTADVKAARALLGSLQQG